VSLVLDEHRRYLADRSRIQHYERALREIIRPGDVVLDVASGTGILGLLACRAGAARVYAIEAGPIADVAREIVSGNGLSDRVTVIRSHSSEAVLPERVDVAVSDQIGRFGFDAGILPLVADIRTRLLKPQGRLVPSSIDLVVAPVEYKRGAARVAFWSRRPAGFDFAPAHRISSNTGYPARFAGSQLLARPHRGVALDLGGSVVSPLRIESAFEVERSATLDGIAGWFSAQLSPSVGISNSPLDPDRIGRRQVFFPVASPIAVTRGDRIELAMRVLPETLVISWTVTVHPVKGAPVTHAQSTLTGMLIDPADIRLTNPHYRPTLTTRGIARRTVLDLCDGTRRLSAIEEEVFARHRALFRSAEEAAVFVGEVVTRYTRDDA